jgi:hypothetical protein
MVVHILIKSVIILSSTDWYMRPHGYPQIHTGCNNGMPQNFICAPMLPNVRLRTPSICMKQMIAWMIGYRLGVSIYIHRTSLQKGCLEWQCCVTTFHIIKGLNDYRSNDIQAPRHNDTASVLMPLNLSFVLNMVLVLEPRHETSAANDAQTFPSSARRWTSGQLLHVMLTSKKSPVCIRNREIGLLVSPSDRKVRTFKGDDKHRKIWHQSMPGS